MDLKNAITYWAEQNGFARTNNPQPETSSKDGSYQAGAENGENNQNQEDQKNAGKAS